MPQPDAVAKIEAEIEAALATVADLLARLPARDFDRLCKEEAALMHADAQYHAAFELPAAFPPERTIGRRVITLLAARHPHMLGGAPEAA